MNMEKLKIGNRVKVIIKNGFFLGEVLNSYPDNFYIRTDEGFTTYVPYDSDWEKIPSSKKIEYNNSVNSPIHYNYGKIEVIDFIDQVTSPYSSYLAFMIGNVIKYVARAPFKNEIEDLKKARWYLDRAIEKWEEKANAK
ncbi:hypothetical protein TP70_02265 [Staphylococcus microti]|uniref:Phage protein n=2 Tax=Staphylococcus microti TaxID=569857 RepID=A0ABR5C9T5_9STAP|nr:hypothetical protein TP70_02265 [Staphylococcus microti]